NAIRCDHGIGTGAQRARGLADEMVLLLASLLGQHVGCGLQILDPAGNIRIAARASGLAIILMVHGPAIETIAGKLVHDGVFALAGHAEVEHPRVDGWTMA